MRLLILVRNILHVPADNDAGEIERAERLLKRTIAKRDMLVSQVQLLCDLAHKVATDKDVLPLFRARKKDIGGLRTQCSLEQDSILDILIQLQREEEYNSIHVPIGNKLSENYYLIMAISDDVLVEPSVSSEPTGVNTARIQSRIQLPKIELPSFDGSILEWRSFRDIYISLVHNNESIDDAERFHYLISRLSGSALSVIKSVPLTAKNYAIAWGALSDRFDNTRLLASAHLDKLFAFKPIAQESLPA